MGFTGVLPAELWLSVFREAVSISSLPGLLDTTWETPGEFLWVSGSHWPHPDLASLAMRRTIVHVNRTWRELGWVIYFDYISVSHTARGREYASSLVDTVAATSRTWRTTRIDIPPSMLVPDNIETLIRLLGTLNDVRVVSLTPFGRSTDSGRERLCQLLNARFRHTLQRFAHSIRGDAFSPNPLLLPDVHLNTLDLAIGQSLDVSWLHHPYTTLTSLHIHLGEYSYTLTSLPALRHLCIHVVPGSLALSAVGAATLLQKSGKFLQSLHLTASASCYGPRGKGWNSTWGSALLLLLDYTPNLCAIVIPYDGMNSSFNAQLDRLTHVGIESPYAPFIGQPPRYLPVLLSKDTLPALQVIRMMSEVNPVRAARSNSRFDRWTAAKEYCDRSSVRLEAGNGGLIEVKAI